jgi:KaiC/GvpD/RAD55 family RecA-like ATPase
MQSAIDNMVYKPDVDWFGVVVLSLITNPPATNYVRAVFVRKMRFTNHSLKYAPFVLGEGGITVYPEAEIFGV